MQTHAFSSTACEVCNSRIDAPSLICCPCECSFSTVGRAWLVQVPPHMPPHLGKAGFAPAPDEMQSAQPPQGPIRGINAVPVEF